MAVSAYRVPATYFITGLWSNNDNGAFSMGITTQCIWHSVYCAYVCFSVYICEEYTAVCQQAGIILILVFNRKYANWQMLNLIFDDDMHGTICYCNAFTPFFCIDFRELSTEIKDNRGIINP